MSESRPDETPEKARPLCVPVHYDFASSLCYVAHRVLGRMGDFFAENSIDLVWTPVDLAPLMGWRRGALVNPVRLEEVKQIATSLDVPILIPESWLDSRGAAAIALHLENQPAREESWRERVFSAIYERGLRPETPTDLDGLMMDLGVVCARADLEQAAQELRQRTSRARENDVTGVPTFMLGAWPFGGIQDESSMRSILTRWATRQRRGERAELISPNGRPD